MRFIQPDQASLQGYDPSKPSRSLSLTTLYIHCELTESLQSLTSCHRNEDSKFTNLYRKEPYRLTFITANDTTPNQLPNTFEFCGV